MSSAAHQCRPDFPLLFVESEPFPPFFLLLEPFEFSVLDFFVFVRLDLLLDDLLS